MPGKRLKDPSLTRTNYPEAVANGAELLTDWNGLVWARPIPIKLVGNSWMQGSYDLQSWDNFIKDDHNYLRVSTDGGITWRVIDLTGDGDNHPPVTIGSPDGGLDIVPSTQVLTLNPAGPTSAGSESAEHWTKTEALKFDVFQNIGGGYELYDTFTDQAGFVRLHDIRTLVAGANVTINYVGDTIEIGATGAGGGVDNQGVNIGTEGVSVFDNNSSPYINFRSVDTLTDILTITLEPTNHTIDFNIVESNIDHDVLENFVPNEHIDHSTVSILTTEGITGGGDLTATRTLTLAFDELTPVLSTEDTDLFALYRPADDVHYSISFSDLKDDLEIVYNTVYVPLTTGIYTTTGLSGGGTLDEDRYINLAFNNLPTVSYAAGDYVAIYDVSNSNHAKITLSDLVGELAVSISAGNGMDFSTITSTGAVTLGTPSTISETTTNSVSATSHTHYFNMASFELVDLGDVDDTPTDGWYLKWDAGTSTWITGDPAVGATAPADPLYSVQFNENGSFGGSAGFLYKELLDRVYISPVTTAAAGIVFGDDESDSPSIIRENASGLGLKLLFKNSSSSTDVIEFEGSRVSIGNINNSDGNAYLYIQDINNTQFENVIAVDNILGDNLLKLDSTGQFYLPELLSASTTDVLYYNSSTGQITYGAAPIGGTGAQTIVTDTLSGLTANGGNSSSESTIELDQNDSKLADATIVTTDYIGFYDSSLSGQRKTLLGNVPSWDVWVNGVSKDTIKIGQHVDFVEGVGIDLAYNAITNALTISSSGTGSGCTQLVDDLGTITDGSTAYLNLDIYSGGIMTVASGANTTLQFDNLEEGDTGHVEITHDGTGTVTIAAPEATDVKIAFNSKATGDQIQLSTVATIDVVVYWFAKGNFHVAVVYDSQ